MPFLQNEAPGFTTVQESEESQVYFGGTKDETMLSSKPFLMGLASTDLGNTDLTTTIRGGMVMMKFTDGKIYPYRQAAKDGRIVGVLPYAVQTVVDGSAADRWVHLFTSGLLKTSELKIGIATGSVPLNALASMGFKLDTGYGDFATPQAGYMLTTGTLNVEVEHNGCIIEVDDVPTLPAIEEGLAFTFVNDSGGTIAITSGDTGNMFSATGKDADTITVADNTISKVEAVDFDGTLTWVLTSYHVIPAT